MNAGWSRGHKALALCPYETPFLSLQVSLSSVSFYQVPPTPVLQILYGERGYIRGIFGKELVYAMPVWNLLERQF